MSNSGNKVQGEGDYDAARRFNKEEREFVDKGVERQRALTSEEEAEGKRAEEQGKSRARDQGHDEKDADLFRKGESKRQH